METTRIRDGLVFLGGGLTGVLEREGAENFRYGEVCYAPLWRVVDNEFMVLLGAAGSLWEHGMIFAKRALTRHWSGAQLIEKTIV